MAKYKVTTIVNAVQIQKADPECVRQLSEMLNDGIPHMFTPEGLVLVSGDGQELEPIIWGDYLVKETHGGFVAITKAAFERQAVKLSGEDEETHS